MQKTVETYEIDGHRVDVVAFGEDEGGIEAFDFWLRDPEGKSDTCLNEGDAWYPESGANTPPTIEEVAGYLRHNEPGLFDGSGEPKPAERHYRLVMLVTVTDEVKAENDRDDMDDEAYVSAESGWAESSFAGNEQLSLTKVPMPNGDLVGKCPLEVLHVLEHGYDGRPGTGWSDYLKLRIMQDYIRQVDPEGFAMFALGLAEEDRSRK